MKRILFLHQASSIGGGSYCLLNIIRELPRAKYVPIVALKKHGPLFDELSKLNIELVLFPQMEDIPYNRHYFSVQSLLKRIKIRNSKSKLEKIIEYYKIDVLYLNNMMLYKYLRIGKKSGVNTILHIREHWPLDEHIIQLRNAQNEVCKYADRIIAINNYSASMFPQCKSKVVIVYDWISLLNRMGSEEDFKPYRELIGNDVKFLLFTGGFDSMKGSYEVMKTFSETIKSGDMKLVILGGSNILLKKNMKYYIKKLFELFGYFNYEKELINMLNLDPRIICVPPTYDIGMLVKQSYGFISFFTTAHANLALAENIILGNPCLAAETDESLEYSHDGSYALLTPFRDLEKFSINLKEFIENRDKYIDMSLNGAPVIKLMFDKDINVKRLLNAIEAL